MNGNGGDVASFLQKLSEDSELQQAYVKDPRGTMQQAGLPDHVIEAMLSRDLGKVKEVVGRELGGEQTLVMVLTEPGA